MPEHKPSEMAKGLARALSAASAGRPSQYKEIFMEPFCVWLFRQPHVKALIEEGVDMHRASLHTFGGTRIIAEYLNKIVGIGYEDIETQSFAAKYPSSVHSLIPAQVIADHDASHKVVADIMAEFYAQQKIGFPFTRITVKLVHEELHGLSDPYAAYRTADFEND